MICVYEDDVPVCVCWHVSLPAWPPGTLPLSGTGLCNALLVSLHQRERKSVSVCNKRGMLCVSSKLSAALVCGSLPLPPKCQMLSDVETVPNARADS